jgi:hypothetical protein
MRENGKESRPKYEVPRPAMNMAGNFMRMSEFIASNMDPHLPSAIAERALTASARDPLGVSSVSSGEDGLLVTVRCVAIAATIEIDAFPANRLIP